MGVQGYPAQMPERAAIPSGALGARPIRWLDRAGVTLLRGDVAGWRMAAAFMAAAWLVFVAPWLLGTMVIPWDAKDFYYPVLRALAAALAAGDSGWWNPSLFAGQSAIADPQSWVMTPAFHLLAALDPAPSMRMADTVQLLHLLAGGLGVLLFGRAIGLRPLAALVAALVFMFGGVAAGRLQHSLMIVSYAHLPWAIYLLHRSFFAGTTGRRLLAAAGFGLAAGLMAVGRDQVAFLNCLFLIGAAGWWLRLAAGRGGIRGLGRQAATLLPALLAGGLILMVPALLTIDALADSTRPAIGYPVAAYSSLQPAALLTLLAPNLFGSLDPAGYWGPGQMPWVSLALPGWDWNDAATTYLYAGAAPIAAIVLAVVRARLRLPTAVTGVVLGGLVFALLYCVGAYTPAYRLFYELLPGVNLFRRPNDAAFLLNAMLAILAGIAAQSLLTGHDAAAPPASTRRIVALGGIGVGAVVAALWLGWYFSRLADAAVALAAGGLLLLVAVVLWRRVAGTATPGRWALVLVAFLVADLVTHQSATPLNARPTETIAAYRPDGGGLGQEIARRLHADGQRYRAEIFGVATGIGDDGGGSWQNAALAYGIEQTLGYDPLRRASYADAIGADQNSNLAKRRFGSLFTGYGSTIARLLGIKLVVTGTPIETILPAEAHASLRLIGRRHGAFLYENADPLPRALIVARAAPDVGGPLPRDPRRLVLIDGLEVAVGAADAPAGTATIRSYRREEVVIETRTPRPAYLVLNDLYDRGWTAEIDGAETPILRANRLFRAVAVPAGRHEVVFRYDPLTLDALIETAGRVLASD